MSKADQNALIESNDDESGEEVSSPEVSPGKLKEISRNNGLEGLEDQLNGLTFDPEAFVRSLPAPVKRRLKALKKLQMERLKVESKFYEELHNLEAKYSAKFAPIDERRANIAAGEVEPTDSECDWKSDDEEAPDEQPEAGGDTKSPNAVNSPDVKGMPDFWLTVLKHGGDVSELIQEHDEPILSHLTDIKLIYSEAGEPISFVLEFHFSPNDYFTNKTLTKKYNMKMEPDDQDIMFEGPEIASSEGCEIDWKTGKNVTVKTIKKKQKHKKSGVQRTVTKQVQNESFFNFFSPPSLEEQEEPSSEEIEAQLQSDYEIGHFIREQIVPRAVLYFTGDALDDSDDEYDEDEDDDDEDDDEESGPGSYPKFARGAGRQMTAGETGDGKNPDCKQQ